MQIISGTHTQDTHLIRGTNMSISAMFVCCVGDSDHKKLIKFDEYIHSIFSEFILHSRHWSLRQAGPLLHPILNEKL